MPIFSRKVAFLFDKRLEMWYNINSQKRRANRQVYTPRLCFKPETIINESEAPSSAMCKGHHLRSDTKPKPRRFYRQSRWSCNYTACRRDCQHQKRAETHCHVARAFVGEF